MTAHSSWKTAALITVLAALAFAQTGCRSARRSDPIVGPLISSDPQVHRGHLLFQQHCYKCHPDGEGGLGPALNDKVLPASLIAIQVRRGLGSMPAFHKSDISPIELEAIVRYILAQRTASKPLAAE
jgi:mono/diheme cytochrome c family protein